MYLTAKFDRPTFSRSEVIVRANKHTDKLEMWANAQRDGRPAEYRRRPLFNAPSLADARYLTALQ